MDARGEVSLLTFFVGLYKNAYFQSPTAFMRTATETVSSDASGKLRILAKEMVTLV